MEYQFYNNSDVKAIATSIKVCHFQDNFINMTLGLQDICTGKKLSLDQYQALGMQSSEYFVGNKWN